MGQPLPPEDREEKLEPPRTGSKQEASMHKTCKKENIIIFLLRIVYFSKSVQRFEKNGFTFMLYYFFQDACICCGFFFIFSESFFLWCVLTIVGGIAYELQKNRTINISIHTQVHNRNFKSEETFIILNPYLNRMDCLEIKKLTSIRHIIISSQNLKIL